MKSFLAWLKAYWFLPAGFIIAWMIIQLQHADDHKPMTMPDFKIATGEVATLGGIPHS